MNRGNEYIEKERKKVVYYEWEGRFYFQHFIHICFYFCGKNTGGTVSLAPPLVTALTPWKNEENHRIKTLFPNKATL